MGSNTKDTSKRFMSSCVTDQKGKVLYYKTKEGGTNNIAEFLALKECIALASEAGEKEIVVLTDSNNNIHWFHKIGNSNKGNRAEAKEIKNIMSSYLWNMNVSVKWIPREQNLAGHFLSKELRHRYGKT